VPFTWEEDGGFTVEVVQLAEQIVRDPEIEGVTFLGGEPFAQARALAELGRIVKQKGLSVGHLPDIRWIIYCNRVIKTIWIYFQLPICSLTAHFRLSVWTRAVLGLVLPISGIIF
jgi:hypothetical protein